MRISGSRRRHAQRRPSGMTGRDREGNSKFPKMSRSNVHQRLWDERDSSSRGGLEQKQVATVNRNDYAAIDAALEAYFRSGQLIERA